MSLERRLQLLDWAQRHRALIIEDDYDSEYRFDGRSLESLRSLDRNGQVAYLGTFSKTLFPSCASATCCRRQACAKRCWRRASWSTGTARPCSNAPSRCSSSAATSPAIRAACNANTPSVAGACWNACTAT